MSHEGAVFHFLMRNLMVIVIIIMVMLSNDLVLIAASFDQRNVAFRYKLESLF